MSGFDAHWLRLREPADAAARAAHLERRLLRACTDAQPTLVDLGAGSGANLRHLAPRLGGSQCWQLVDHDADLLAAARRQIADWGRARQARVSLAGAELTIDADDFACRVRFVEADLARDPAVTAWPPGAIVTASALLDLVSARWIEQLVAACAHGRHAALFALSYDGRIVATPPDALDAELTAAFNEHQRRDKGFGPALGPRAADAAAAVFAAAGFAVDTAPSDWHLEAGDAALADALLRGIGTAAGDTEPRQAASYARWADTRSAAIAGGRGRLLIGHRDLLALPGRR